MSRMNLSILGEPPSPSTARALIRSLTRGTAIARGARYIHVGHASWTAAQLELLSEVAEDGHSETKFVRGAYGAGKSHFLSVVQDMARDEGWVTSHIECKADKVQIDRFETVYPSLAGKISLPPPHEGTEGNNTSSAARLLDIWARQQLKAAGIKEDGLVRPFDADFRLYIRLQQGVLSGNLPPDFAHALVAYARGALEGDFETTYAVGQWLNGYDAKVRVPLAYLERPEVGSSGRGGHRELRPVGKGTAQDAMRGLLWLVRSAGYAGLVLCIDEVEELAKLGNRKRQDQALQALREYVDHAGGEGGYRHLCMYLAATPEMFEGEAFFPRYDALATRIQSVSREINWRAPVVDLDRTPLSREQMVQVAMRIKAVHEVAYPVDGQAPLSDASFAELVDEVMSTRIRVAKPRLLARVVVDELERARQQAALPPLSQDVSGRVTEAASALAREIEQ